MKGLFGDSALETIKNIKKIFLWSAVCTLIGVFVLGAIFILSDGAGGAEMGKIIGTLFMVSVVLFVGVNNFVRMENDNKAIQSFGLMSLICNIIWLIIAILLIWGVIPAVVYEYEKNYYGLSVSTTHLTVMTKIVIIAASLGSAGFWISNVLSIKETVRPIKPLKITAIICEAYCSIFAIVVAFSNVYGADMGKWYLLSSLAGFPFVASAFAAWIISRTNKKDKQDKVDTKNTTTAEVTNKPAKSDEELRAEIEEQVRKEMIEKEVRARMEAEMGKKEGEQ